MTGRVFVVGSVNEDIVLRIPRIPTPGETILAHGFEHHHGGKGANQAVAAARLGCRVSLAAAVGRDELGAEALAQLDADGVDTGGVVRADASTGVAIILVDDDGENLIVVAPGANDLLTGPDVERCLGQIGEADAVVASLEVPEAAILAAARVAHNARATFVLNPAPARILTDEVLAAIDILTPNINEVSGLGFDSMADFHAAGVGTVVVTRGGRGANVYPSLTPAFHQEAFPVSVVDTTGAGDAFTAGLAAAMAMAMELRAAVRWATAVAGLATQALGARGAYPTGDEVASLIANSALGAQYELPETLSRRIETPYDGSESSY